MTLSFGPLARARGAVSAAAMAASLLAAAPAFAQQPTFHLDRLEVPGAPDDGMVLFRPVTQPNTIFYAQLGLGYSLNPLRTSNITSEPATLRASQDALITTQFSSYMSAGFEFFDHLTLGGTFPVAWIESGNPPNNQQTAFIGSAVTANSTNGPAVGDLRLDARYVIWRNEDRSLAFGAQLSAFVPTGQGSATNFGGDGGNVEWLPMVNGEWVVSKKIPVSVVVNTGFHLRSENAINDPAGLHGPANGLGIGDEWRWAVGGFLPLAGGRFRVGADIFGQTGITNDNITGPTAFTKQNTPIEWDIEGRMRLPIFGSTDKWFVGAGGGSLLAPGYGAPDFRFVALFGSYVEIHDTDASSPEGRMKARAAIRDSLKDSDGDGIPDDVDACPSEPEDHKEPDAGDGCPAPSDRDGDGIPDQYDKCPDVPEDKDGIDDQDGCPEDDADNDGIPDAKDACPKEPGQPDPDPKKNGCPKFIKLEGSTVRILQQVHFATGSATILPDSFPMLLEIAKLLQATPAIKKMVIEGHTDDRGDAAMNLDLSKRRAASVATWLTQHGIEGGRLTSQGYGEEKPIETNATDAGRQANRRVEFHITEEDTGSSSKGGDMDSGKKPVPAE